jgi:hypothetical protein
VENIPNYRIKDRGTIGAQIEERKFIAVGWGVVGR